MSTFKWNVAQTYAYIQMVVASACKHMNWKGGKDGYACVATSVGTPLLKFVLGKNKDKEIAVLRRYFCLESVRHLGTNSGHVSSWQSRDPSDGKTGGSIRVKGYILSLSFPGLSDHITETCVMAWARLVMPEQLSPTRLKEILVASRNPWRFEIGVVNNPEDQFRSELVVNFEKVA